MADSILSDAERRLLRKLDARGVRYPVVGSGPPRIGGDELGERFDVVTHMDGLDPFAQEYSGVKFEVIEDVRLPLLPLRRILQSKKVAGRPKDLLAAHAIEDALSIIEAGD